MYVRIHSLTAFRAVVDGFDDDGHARPDIVEGRLPQEVVDGDVDSTAAKDVLGLGEVSLEAAVQLSGAQLVIRGRDLELNRGGLRGCHGFSDALFQQAQPHSA